MPSGPITPLFERQASSHVSLSLYGINHYMSRLLGRLWLAGTEGLGLTWLGFMGLGDHRADKKNRQESRRYSSRQNQTLHWGRVSQKRMCGQKGNWTGRKGLCQREVEEEIKYRNTELQYMSFLRVLSFCLHPSKGSSVPLCPWPEGEQGCSLCFLYLVRGQSPCKQRLLCAFGVRCEPGRGGLCVHVPQKSLHSRRSTLIQAVKWAGCRDPAEAMTEHSVTNIKQIP